MRGLIASTFVAVALGASGCDLRPYLAQTDFFADLRPELIAQCCECLATSETTATTATCSEAFVKDGEVITPGDAVFASDDDPISCLCQGDVERCNVALETGGDIVVPGACIDQVEIEAPCEAACAGVLTFDPLPTQ